MMEIIDKIEALRIVPVVVIDDAADAIPLARALCNGGLPCAEVTFRTAAAKEAIRLMSEAFPQMLIGAGTILTTRQVDDAMEAGARFIVSPGFDGEIVEYCQSKKIPIFPGCMTPSEVIQAVKHGLEVIKFFPAEPAGGMAMIRSLAAVYTNVRFMPTGGIDMNNLESYLSFDRIAACGGSWMVNKTLVAQKSFDTITELTKEAVCFANKIGR